ncbi:MAG TPA: cob(I)yrinic acid a,c-diamide adenosyltransferase [Lachnospiraceae bacterium]|nr:cob(I)yrinic acid a,c-diamide adenosyltransferase [Lachnospiraceae bacterium]
MEQGMIQIYSGDGHGKSSAAFGRAIKAAGMGKKVVIIQFLKGMEESEFIKRLEPEIKIFRFEKSYVNFSDLSDEQKNEEVQNIKNGLNFAKKVLNTGECDLLILDEVLGLIDNKIIEVSDLKNILDAKSYEESVILTGIQLNDETCVLADEVFTIQPIKFKVF